MRTGYARAVTDRRSLLAPSELRPLDLDLRRVFWVFIALWGVALVVVVVLALTGSVAGRMVAICATGFGLGFVALAWERWRFGPRRGAGEPSSEAPENGAVAPDPETLA